MQQTEQMSQLDGVRRAALEIAARRREELRNIKQALVGGDEKTAVGLMREFLGIPTLKTKTGEYEHNQSGNRIDQSLN